MYSSLIMITDSERNRNRLFKAKPYARTLDKLRDALEAAGVVFVDSNGHGPGVRFREPGEYFLLVDATTADIVRGHSNAYRLPSRR